jgi:hypothetical protein
MEMCVCHTSLPLDSAYEKALSAIPAIIKSETKKKLNEIINFTRDDKNKYIEHAGVLWEYDKTTGILNKETLCPIDRTPLLIYEDTNKLLDYSSIITGMLKPTNPTRYWPKCNNKYLIEKSTIDIERMRKEVIAIIKGENKKQTFSSFFSPPYK